MSDISWDTTQPAMRRGNQHKVSSWTHLLCGLACIMLVLFTTHSFQFFFADELAGGHFALSLDVEVNNPALSRKRNGISKRLAM